MSEERHRTEKQESWWVMGKSLAFVYGVPVGIGAGAIVGAAFDILNFGHSAAWGLLAGVASGAIFGGLIGRRAARTNYKWIHSELTVASDTEWAAVVKALNVKAATQHYLLAQREDDYVAYAPTLVRPVAAGPLTVSGEYLSVVVTRLNNTAITITGPRYMVDAFEGAATAAEAA